MAEPLEQGIGSADPCPSGAGKEVAAWNAPRMGTLIFTHMPNVGRFAWGGPVNRQSTRRVPAVSTAPLTSGADCLLAGAVIRRCRFSGVLTIRAGGWPFGGTLGLPARAGILRGG